MPSQNPFPTGCADFGPRLYVGTRTVSLFCEGESVVVTRQGRSCISQAHADSEARRLAEAEARRELDCWYVETQWAIPRCGGTVFAAVSGEGRSRISQEDAHRLALAAAQEAARLFCEGE